MLLALLQPDGQQPSATPPEQANSEYWHCTLQVDGEPESNAVKHATGGHWFGLVKQKPGFGLEIALSQISGVVTTTSPQHAKQSTSLAIIAPNKQQPSLLKPNNIVIFICTQIT